MKWRNFQRRLERADILSSIILESLLTRDKTASAILADCISTY